jgi:hypothetical protein
MDSPEDSLVSSTTGSRLKPVIITVALVGLAAGAWWMFGRGKGQPEDPMRVLIVGPTPELSGYLERKGFDPDYLSFGAAVGEGQAFDQSLDDLPAIVEYADQLGFGYVALSMAHGERYDLAAIEYEAAEPPPGTTFMVMSIGDLGNSVSYGGVPPGVLHEHPLDEQIGLLLALLNQPELAKARSGQAVNDVMIRFGSAGTIKDVEAIEQAQEKMRRLASAWDALAERERGTQKPIELAQPFERLVGWPLANGAILLGSARGGWRSKDGLTSEWDTAEAVAELSVTTPDQLDQRSPCPALPDRLALDGGFAIAPSGDALLIPSNSYIAELWTLTGERCGFERRDEIRRLEHGELGQPRAIGRTAASQTGRLRWADAKMQAFRSAHFAGIELRPDALRWVTDDIVVVPASLDFVFAAELRQQRASEAAIEAGLPAPALAPIDATQLPAPTEALVFLRIPPAEQKSGLELAVIPAGALVRGDSAPVNLRAAFPITGESPTIVTYVDSKDGLQLIRTSLAASGPAWQNGFAIEYDLAAAVEAGAAAINTEVLARELPLDAQELAVSPTGSHAAWAAPVEDSLEIVLLSLASPSEPPLRMTDNQRDDSGPFFAGDLLLFYSEYRVDDAPALETLRALPIP